MKKYVLLVILLAILLTACRPSQNNPAAGGFSTEPPATPTETDTPTDPPTDPTSVSTEPPVDQAELDKFTALFGDMNSWYNRTAGHCYDSPEKLSLFFFFHCGFDDESQKPTDAEWAELEGKPGFNINYDLFRLPSEKINNVLTAYFGIMMDDLSPESFDHLVYLESTDCYYFMATGAEGYAIGFTATDLENLDDGSMILSYTLNNGKNYEMGLKTHGDGYLILFNRPAD